LIDFPDLTPEEKAFRAALGDPRKLRALSRELNGQWEWRQAAEALRRFYARRRSAVRVIVCDDQVAMRVARLDELGGDDGATE
jgi:hypothetical protein